MRVLKLLPGWLFSLPTWLVDSELRSIRARLKMWWVKIGRQAANSHRPW